MLHIVKTMISTIRLEPPHSTVVCLPKRKACLRPFAGAEMQIATQSEHAHGNAMHSRGVPLIKPYDKLIKIIMSKGSCMQF